jgi:hypothetical protein
MKRLMIVGVALLGIAAVTAHAGEKQGRILSMMLAPEYPDRAFIKVEGTYSPAEPSCSAGVSSWDFVLDTSTSTGKAMYALALAAQNAQSVVIVNGLGTCLLQTNYETVRYISEETP